MPVLHDMLGKLPLRPGTRVRNRLAGPELGARDSSAHENILEPGAVIPRHRHGVEEVIVCLEGEAVCEIGDGPPQPYGAGSVVIVPPATAHAIRNVGAGRLRQLCFFPAGSPQTTWLEPEGEVTEVDGASRP